MIALIYKILFLINFISGSCSFWQYFKVRFIFALKCCQHYFVVLLLQTRKKFHCIGTSTCDREYVRRRDTKQAVLKNFMQNKIKAPGPWSSPKEREKEVKEEKRDSFNLAT